MRDKVGRRGCREARIKELKRKTIYESREKEASKEKTKR